MAYSNFTGSSPSLRSQNSAVGPRLKLGMTGLREMKKPTPFAPKCLLNTFIFHLSFPC